MRTIYMDCGHALWQDGKTTVRGPHAAHQMLGNFVFRMNAFHVNLLQYFKILINNN